MNKSGAANVASQAGSKAAARRRQTKETEARLKCDHNGPVKPWQAEGTVGEDCAKCGQNVSLNGVRHTPPVGR